jgi:hypothetical protein
MPFGVGPRFMAPYVSGAAEQAWPGTPAMNPELELVAQRHRWHVRAG